MLVNEKALLALGELRAIIPSLPNPELISKPFLRREAVLSSKIEGTKTEIEGLYLFESTRQLRKPDRYQTEESQDAREVANYVTALEHGLSEIKTIPICNRLFREMHEILLKDVHRERGLDTLPGRFRSGQAHIGPTNDIRDARYVAPPHEHVEDLMAALEIYINRPNSDRPTLTDVAMIHYQFEAIHPFSDGNGRLGRLLINLLLSARGILPQPLLYLSAFFERNRERYNTLLWEVSRSGAWKDWVLFVLQGVESESIDATRRARSLLALREQYRSQLQSGGSAGRLLALVDELFLWPTITIPRARDVLGLTYEGAKKNVKKLETKGVITKLEGPARNQLWIARPIIALMS